MAEKMRNLMVAKSVWKVDPYYGYPVNVANVQITQSFYLEDKWDCSHQSTSKIAILSLQQLREKKW